MKKLVGILLLTACMRLHAMQGNPPMDALRSTRTTEIFDEKNGHQEYAVMKLCERKGAPEITNEMHQFFSYLAFECNTKVKVTVYHDTGIWMIQHTNEEKNTEFKAKLGSVGFKTKKASSFFKALICKMKKNEDAADVSSAAGGDSSELLGDDVVTNEYSS